MGLTAKDSGGGGNFAPCPEGSHIAVCTHLVDLGTQYSKFYDKNRPRILFGWEIDEQRDDGERFMVWAEYTMSLHENASLRKVLEGWRGRAFTAKELKGFALKNVLGKPCTVTVQHNESNGRTYANVITVGGIPKQLKGSVFEPSKTVLFDLEDPDMSVYADFGDSLKAKIASSPEWKQSQGTLGENNPEEPQGPVGSEDDDQIPF